MKKKLLLAIVFLVLVTGAQVPVPHAGTEADPFVVYDKPTVKIVADPFLIILTNVTVEFERKDGANWVPAFTVSLDTVIPAGEEPVVPIHEKVATMPDGDYRFRMRVLTETQKLSPWSDWFYANKGWVEPPAPTGCRIFG